MFDIGFFELLLIGVVALIVIGPEQLPETLRSVALWWGRLKRGMQSARTELEQQIGADDIRRQLHNEDIMRQLAATKTEIESSVDTALGRESTSSKDNVQDKNSAQSSSDNHPDKQPD